MAGQGWREWVAGEQLTDEKMQQFLQDQAVMRFDNASDRTTTLNGVVSEGMVSYLDDTNKVEYYDGSEWEELTGDPDIFTQGTAGNFLRSLGTAGVEWNAATATTGSAGVLFGATSTDGTFPNALGHNALANDAVGGGFLSGNIGIANNAGGETTTGHNNVFIGQSAAQSNTTGARNLAIGTQALFRNPTGDNNVAVGFAAGFGSQFGSAISQNTFIGAEVNIDTVNFLGNNNTIIGYKAQQSAVSVSNEITLGNSSVATLRCQVTSITSLSDARDKKNVEELSYGLEFVKALKPVSFDWDTRDGAKVDVPDFGFIAQDLVELEDNHNAQRLALTLRNNPDKLEATQGRLIPILVKAIQELSAKVEELENAR
jgi:hypothetical protein